MTTNEQVKLDLLKTAESLNDLDILCLDPEGGLKIRPGRSLKFREWILEARDLIRAATSVIDCDL
jgi:hypothetical protein